MKLLLFFGVALTSAREPLTWTWYDIETNSTTDYMAILPEAADYKNQTAAYKEKSSEIWVTLNGKIFHENLPKFSTREKECQKYGMNLVTIGSLEEQKNIMEQLKKYEREPAVYWISLDRKDKKSGWRWKYPGKFLKPLCQNGRFPPLRALIVWFSDLRTY